MVKHPENEHVSENGGDGGEIGSQKGEKGDGGGIRRYFQANFRVGANGWKQVF
jgi:hypothetical protein